MNDFRLPDVGEGLEEAEIIEWLVAEGDVVARDQPLVEILTDKSQTQLPSPRAGRIVRLGFTAGDLATVGDVLVEFADESDADQTRAGQSDPDETDAGQSRAHETDAGQRDAPAEHDPVSQPSAPIATEPVRARPKAAPVVRKRALEAGVDLAAVTPTGPGGRITVADLDAHLARPKPTAPPPSRPPDQPAATVQAPTQPPAGLGVMPVGRHPLRGIRRVTANAMERTLTVPHIHGSDELDATNLLAGRAAIRSMAAPSADRLTLLAFFVMAVASGLRRYPLLNASITLGDDPAIDVHPDIHVGIAVATDAGLIVPVIRHADRRSLLDLADEIGRLTTTARSGRIDPGELRGGTITISNYGSLGGRFATPLIRPPEVAIVGFGSIRPRPFVVDGSVVARPTLPIAVGADHRLIDGDVMTAFQEHLITVLTDPVALLVDPATGR